MEDVQGTLQVLNMDDNPGVELDSAGFMLLNNMRALQAFHAVRPAGAHWSAASMQNLAWLVEGHMRAGRCVRMRLTSFG